jgi:hypothetical protein
MFMGLSRWIVFGDSMQAEKSLIEAARLGDHFLSERPEKCVPMADG